MIKKVTLLIFLLITTVSLSSQKLKRNQKIPILEEIYPTVPGELPLIPLVPALPIKSEEIVEDLGKRVLEKTYTVMLESKVNVFVPLEIISDIDIKAMIVGDQEVEVPFELELNREPERKNWYSLHYSETEIDIDKDGQIDTYIYSPEYINSKIIKDNYVKIYGSKISKEGTHNKKVYITIKVKD